MKDILFYFIIAVVTLAITFFGIGPVLFADGSALERFITLIVVILLYVVLFVVIRRYRKNK